MAAFDQRDLTRALNGSPEPTVQGFGEPNSNACVGQPTPSTMLIWPRGETVDDKEALKRVRFAHRLSRFDGAGASAQLAFLVSGGWLQHAVLDESGQNRGYTRAAVDPPVPGSLPAHGQPTGTVYTVPEHSRLKAVQVKARDGSWVWITTNETEIVPAKYYDHATGQEIPKPPGSF